MIIRRIESRIEQRRKRVGAYARVSTDKAAQEESFETQCRYYETFIRSNPQWDYIRVYADTGKSGTSVNKRVGFQQMLEDARKGKVDIIYCKSISRFARNVADAQRYARELKGLGVEVRFEREVLSTFDSSADIIFNILAAVAQEESRSISENTKWAYQKNAEKGIRRLGNNRVLGYDVEEAGELVPNKDAWIIRLIFEMYAADATFREITQALNDRGAKRMRSKKPFSTSAVQRILDNEIYVGDRLLQKKASCDYLTKRPDGLPYADYYIADDHKAIVDRDTWEMVRARRRRAEVG